MSTTDISSEKTNDSLHKLNDKWTLWAHLPHDVNWDVDSYKKIFSFDTVEEAIVLFNSLPDSLIKNCMLFVMRDGILPIWEDKKNSKGGCFSYKVNNKTIIPTWKELFKALVSERLIEDETAVTKCNGITISPKRNFCIVKIWLLDCSIQNPQKITDISGLTRQGCLFKKHNPEF
jgi:hypothetical protein